MKRRLQDISNQDGYDDEQEGKTSPEIRRRRVAMEKRRRDKINEYLDELSQLVPEAAEKVGCTKLEKAEVLEMTVDYVKKLFKEQKARSQPAKPDPETERKRGFMTCMVHIEKYLEDNDWLMKNNEKANSRQDFFTQRSTDAVQPAMPENAADSSGSLYPSVYTQQAPSQQAPAQHAPSQHAPTQHAPPQQSQDTIFNKICLDFLKNSAAVDAYSNVDQPVKLNQCAAWQQCTNSQENARDSNNNGGYLDEINLPLPFGSFLSSVNEGC